MKMQHNTNINYYALTQLHVLWLDIYSYILTSYMFDNITPLYKYLIEFTCTFKLDIVSKYYASGDWRILSFDLCEHFWKISPIKEWKKKWNFYTYGRYPYFKYNFTNNWIYTEKFFTTLFQVTKINEITLVQILFNNFFPLFEMFFLFCNRPKREVYDIQEKFFLFRPTFLKAPLKKS